MKETVPVAQAATAIEELPPRVAEALGGLAGAAKEGLLALSIGVGLGVLGDDVRLAVMMIDGIELKGRTNVVALGITSEGVKLPLGLWEGSTENATVATALLSDLVDRGLDPEQAILFVIEGAKALRKAIRAVFGERAVVHRCVRPRRGTCSSTCPRDRPAVTRRLRRAWAETDHDRALDQLRLLASELDRSHPGAAASLCEGLEETLTLARLGIRGRLRKTLESTNPVRVDDRVRAPHQPQRQALAVRRTWRCAGQPPGCSKPSANSGASPTTPTWPSSSPRSSAKSTSPQPHPRRRRPFTLTTA